MSDIDFDDDDDEFLYDESGEDFLDEDELDFTEIIQEKQEKKKYEVDYKVYSIEEIEDFQNKEIEHVATIIGCLKEHAATLLRHFKWNKERLIELYMDKTEEVTKEAGVIVDAQKLPKLVKIPDFSCDICCDSGDDIESLALSCGHRFCRDCYSQYLTQKIKVEGECRNIQCPSDCNIIVDENTIRLLVSEDTYRRYTSLLIRTYVDDNIFLRWCPAPNCEYAVECRIHESDLQKIIPTVKCKCGYSFCFGCGLSDHQPCICELVRKWLNKCRDDSETANWISVNTKECPKCKASIEKNGGCNHMTCKKCRNEFCWVCMGPWSEHGNQWYTCNRYEEKTSIDARDSKSKSRAKLERYLHYYNRYANHEQSAKLDTELYEKTERKMERMQKSSELSWIEVQFLKEAVETVVQCRNTLMWTYSFAFYLQKDNQTTIFEDNQRDLEMAVEQLSELLEEEIKPNKIAELKQRVVDKSIYVKHRREILLEDTAQGLKDSRWTFIDP